MPYVAGEKNKHKYNSNRKIKFPEIVDRFITRIETEQVKH